jgi:hypothetical protein
MSTIYNLCSDKQFAGILPADIASIKFEYKQHETHQNYKINSALILLKKIRSMKWAEPVARTAQIVRRLHYTFCSEYLKGRASCEK